MAHVQKSPYKSGAAGYVVKWRDGGGAHHTSGRFATRKAAETYSTTLDYRADRGVSHDPRSGDVPFREAAAAWLTSRVDLKPTTAEGYRLALAPRQRQTATAKLSIDATFGGWPIGRITRVQIADWVGAFVKTGATPSTVRNAYFLVRMVLAQAVVDGRLQASPADHIKLPTERSGGGAGVVDDPAQFLTADQVAAAVDATPWPYNVLVHLAAWSGLRAAELGGLQVGDVTLPAPSLNPNAPAKPGALRVERTVQVIGGELTYGTPKTRGSRRRVPLTPDTVSVLRDYLAAHPRAADPAAPLFPASTLVASRPTGVRATDDAGARTVPTAADALAALSVEEAEARLVLDWDAPLRHSTYYKAVFRPAVLRAVRLNPGAGLPAGLRHHALRHTYVSLCVAAGIPALAIAKFAGHAKVTTTLVVYAHLFETDDHSDAMAALGAMSTPRPTASNVVAIRSWA